MSPRHRIILSLLALCGLVLLGGCQQSGSGENPSDYLPLYGDRGNDTSPVLARVGEVEITQTDMDQYLEELPPAQHRQYEGADGRRLALKHMVDKAVLALGAIERELYNDSDVARTLISRRRETLESAMTNYGLLLNRQPSDEELQAFFQEHRSKYRQLGLIKARDLDTSTKADADNAYRRLLEGGPKNNYPYVVKDLCVNEELRKLDGDLGWFNDGGIIPIIPNSQEFTTKAFALPDGLNPPFKVGDRWHVVELYQRQPARSKTFAEARDQVLRDMLPGYQDAIIKDYLLEARKHFDVKMFGEYGPGQGMTVDEIFARAMVLPEAKDKLDLFTLIHTDYPESDRADDALFMAAQVAIEMFADTRIAGRYLQMLIDEYPNSELIDDATYMRDNINDPEMLRRLRGSGSGAVGK